LVKDQINNNNKAYNRTYKLIITNSFKIKCNIKFNNILYNSNNKYIKTNYKINFKDLLLKYKDNNNKYKYSKFKIYNLLMNYKKFKQKN